MNPRRRNRRVTIQSNAPVQDATTGIITNGWTTVATVWANVRFLSGVETIKADAATSVAKASLGIGYRTDIKPQMRVILGSTTFEIKAVLPDEEDKNGLYLACEVVNG